MILPSISVVMPVYNSEETRPELIRALEPVLKAQAVEFELNLVNDASKARSREAVQRLVQDHEWIKGINLMQRNLVLPEYSEPELVLRDYFYQLLSSEKLDSFLRGLAIV